MKSPIRLVIFKSNNYRENEKKRIMKMHKHSSLEISYVLSGELLVEFYSKTSKQIEKTHIFPHQFFIVRPGCEHCVNIPTSVTTLCLEFIVDNGQILDHLKKSNYVCNLPYAEKILDAFNDILLFSDNQNVAYLLNKFKKYTIESPDPYADELYALELKRLLIEILKCTKEPLVTSGQNIYIKKAIAYISGNYSKDIHPLTVANYLQISEVYLQKLFRKSLNTSVNDYINDVRIEKSQKLIANTNFPIQKIAMDTGYKSVQSFISNFKKRTNMTPSDYKKREIHNDSLLFQATTPENYQEEKTE